jgi:hypothetical protein
VTGQNQPPNAPRLDNATTYSVAVPRPAQANHPPKPWRGTAPIAPNHPPNPTTHGDRRPQPPTQPHSDRRPRPPHPLSHPRRSSTPPTMGAKPRQHISKPLPQPASGPSPRLASPRHATPRHATPRHATPRHATPRHATNNDYARPPTIPSHRRMVIHRQQLRPVRRGRWPPRTTLRHATDNPRPPARSCPQSAGQRPDQTARTWTAITS